MKKSLLFAVALLALSACSKEEGAGNESGNVENPDETIQIETVDLKVTAVPGSYATRTVLDGLKTNWEEQDCISLFLSEPDAGAFGEASRLSTSGGNDFTGKIAKTSLEGNHDCIALYPAVPDKQMNVAFASTLFQNGTGNTSHLAGEYFPMYGVATNAAADRLNFEMSHLAAIVKVTVCNIDKEDLSIKSFSLTAPEAISGYFGIEPAGGEVALTALDGRNSHSVQVLFEEPLTVANKAAADIYLSVKPFTIPAGGKMVAAINGAEQEITFAEPVQFVAGAITEMEVESGEEEVEDPSKKWSVWDGNTPEAFNPEGEGTEENPYLISSAADFAAMSHEVNVKGNTFAGKYLRLNVNIDLDDKPFVMIGNGSTLFSGIFDGCGLRIKHVNVSAEDLLQVGLFRNLGSNAVLKNLVLEEVTAPKAKDSAGALVGNIGGQHVTIDNVTVINPEIQSGAHAGGLIGACNAANAPEVIVIKNCKVLGGHIAGGNAGGLAGMFKSGELIGCCTAVDEVKGRNTAGGLVGQGFLIGAPDAIYQHYIIAAGCYTKSHIVNENNIQAAGIGAMFFGEIKGCYSESSLEYLKNVDFKKHVNNLVCNYIYRVPSAPENRMPALIDASFAPKTLEPVEKFNYHLAGNKQYTLLPHENNGYYFNDNGVEKPTAQYMSMKVGGKDSITQAEVDAMNAALAGLTDKKYHGINEYHFELGVQNDYGFPAMLVK